MWSSVIARRAARNFLDEPGSDVGEVVAAMGGAHAQVMSAGLQSVALRLKGGTVAGVTSALWDDRTLVKTWGPRGTVHLLPTRDLGLWTAALSALPHKSPMTPGKTDQIVAALSSAVRDAADGLTVDELGAEVVKRAGSWAGDLVMPAFQTMWPRWRQIVGTPATQGVLCFGPPRGRKVTYTSPPAFTPWEPSAALQEVVRRYLWSYGPATPAEITRWLAVPPAFLRSVLPLEIVDDPLPDSRASGVRLLPYFDAYVVASHPREVVFPGRAFTRALNRGQAGNFPVLLVDGLAAGVWHQRRAGRRVHLTVEPVEPLSRHRLAALDDEVARLGQALDLRPTLEIGVVSVGPHA
ncbi:winged helix DNA-binding domain-containing protein [Actinoplanes bogorensis]|uniref:Winged helix DNA-binding domain-containing protein n=1 Tax=Paractinoplanes bogorensis TaxID=1610840 RepID=A0ABS5Z3A6_9ACTN|nr:winged helix DNA-binding domain-containing protein [Actinoplanes bogorensis]MBU2668910.1 winged helix DNA-binding domain-containing protein [Actinoplanes bogorensis]